MQEPIILYQDEQIIVVDKPSGMAVHSDGVHDYPLLTDWLLPQFPELVDLGEKQVLRSGEEIARPGIVHRLDRETSGVLVIARTAAAYASLKEQFRDRETRKIYRAFVHGVIKDDRGIIDKPIGSSRGGMGPRSALLPHGTVRDALTAYRVISRKQDVGELGATYVEVFPKTGRTHQIRVHFSAIQRPVICDRLYAPRRPALLGFDRLALHAYSLTLTHPSGKEMTFTAPLPADFLEAERQIAQ